MSPPIDLVKEAFSQYWLHVRHQELQRLTFTSIYSIVVAGALGFLAAIGLPVPLSFLLIAFVMILSLIGLLVTMAWRVPFLEYMALARKLLEDHGLKQYNPYEGKSAKKPMTAYGAFLRFYEINFSLMTALIVWLVLTNILCALLAFVLFMLILEIITHYLTTLYEKPFRPDIPSPV